MSSVLFLFLTHLGIGIAATLLLVGRDAGVKFFRFNAGLAVVLLLIALAFQPPALSNGVLETIGTAALVLATLLLLVYWASVGRVLSGIRTYLLLVAVTAGVVALISQALGLSTGEMGLSHPLTVVSFLSSAALLGGACTAMILGHWYLVLPSMDVSLLQSIVRFHIGSTVVRIVVVAAVVFVALNAWQAPSGASYSQYIFSCLLYTSDAADE